MPRSVLPGRPRYGCAQCAETFALTISSWGAILGFGEIDCFGDADGMCVHFFERSNCHPAAGSRMDSASGGRLESAGVFPTELRGSASGVESPFGGGVRGASLGHAQC